MSQSPQLPQLPLSRAALLLAAERGERPPEALGAVLLRTDKGCGSGLGLWPRQGSPGPVWALGLILTQHPPILQALELLALEELCSSKEGFPGNLQHSRSWEMAAGPRKGALFLG